MRNARGEAADVENEAKLVAPSMRGRESQDLGPNKMSHFGDGRFGHLQAAPTSLRGEPQKRKLRPHHE